MTRLNLWYVLNVKHETVKSVLFISIPVARCKLLLSDLIKLQASQPPPDLDLDDADEEADVQSDVCQEEVQDTSSDSAFSQASVTSSVAENNIKVLNYIYHDR